MLRVLKLLVMVPLGLVLVVFGVANRAPVTLVLEPFSVADDGLSVTLPLFVIIFALVTLGVIIGSLATWLAQGRHRREGRLARHEVERLVSENMRLKTTLSSGTTGPLDLR